MNSFSKSKTKKIRKRRELVHCFRLKITQKVNIIPAERQSAAAVFQYWLISVLSDWLLLAKKLTSFLTDKSKQQCWIPEKLSTKVLPVFPSSFSNAFFHYSTQLLSAQSWVLAIFQSLHCGWAFYQPSMHAAQIRAYWQGEADDS